MRNLPKIAVPFQQNGTVMFSQKRRLRNGPEQGKVSGAHRALNEEDDSLRLDNWDNRLQKLRTVDDQGNKK